MMDKIKQETFIYADKLKRVGQCLCDVIADDTRWIVVFTEIQGNPGPSVTNAIESIIAQFCQVTGITSEQVTFIERYQSHPEHLDLINYQANGPMSWRRLSEHEAKPILNLL